MSSVKRIISEKGPLPTSKLKEIIMADGVKDAAARQRISRATKDSEVRELSTIKLPKREKFLYLNDQYGSSEFWHSLVKAHTDVNSSYGLAMQGILARGGIIPEKHFHIACGAPKKLKKKISSEVVLEKLIDCNLLKRVKDPNLGDCIAVDGQGHLSHLESRSKKINLLAEEIIINGFQEWVKKLGFASYSSIDTRFDDDIPSFGQFGFDITAPSYVYPLVNKNSESTKPGFIVADVIQNTNLTKNEVQYFVSKCRTNRQFDSMPSFMAYLVTERFTKEAFEYGKQEGLIFTTPKILFGEEIAESLKNLISTLDNAAAVAAKEPDGIAKLFKSLTKIQGTENNLKGALFELIVGHLVLEEEGNSIDIGEIVTNRNGKKAEIDVRRFKGKREVALYECKGYHPDTEISKGKVKKWLTKKVPIIRDALLREIRFRNADMTFEYWTTAQFTEPAIEFLKESKKRTQKYDIDWKDGDELLAYAKKVRTNSIIDVLKNHYL